MCLSGESQGQRSLAGYSPWGCKGSDTTERVHVRIRTHTRTHTHTQWQTALKMTPSPIREFSPQSLSFCCPFCADSPSVSSLPLTPYFMPRFTRCVLLFSPLNNSGKSELSLFCLPTGDLGGLMACHCNALSHLGLPWWLR